MIRDYKFTMLPKLFITYFNERLSRDNLSATCFPYLMALKGCDGLTMADLNRELLMDKANTSRVINDLKRQGIVDILYSDTDKRVKRVCLTIKGKELIDKIIIIKNEWELKLFEGISEGEINLMDSLLIKMLSNAKQMLTDKEQDNA